MSGEKQATPHDRLISRIESCLWNSDAELHAGQPVYDPYEQWKACVEVLQDALRALTAPPPHADDVALVDAIVEQTKPIRELEKIRTALLARLSQTHRDAVIEDEATVERVAEAIEAADLAGKADTAKDIARAAIRALKGK